MIVLKIGTIWKQMRCKYPSTLLIGQLSCILSSIHSILHSLWSKFYFGHIYNLKKSEAIRKFVVEVCQQIFWQDVSCN